MKYLIIIVALLLSSCSEDEDKSTNQKGCMTGVVKNSGTTDRTLIRCCTKNEYLAGDNVSQGGISTFSYYTAHKWELCGDCK